MQGFYSEACIGELPGGIAAAGAIETNREYVVTRRREHVSEPGPIRVFARNGKWLVDYGSYAHGYHVTRAAAIETATKAARDECRELLVEGA